MKTLDLAASPADHASEHVAEVAIRAYAAMSPGVPFQKLDYRTAMAHCTGDPLADYLVIELTESARGGDEAAQCQYAAAQLYRAVETLLHVRRRLLDRANSSTSLTLPFPEAPDAARAP